MPRRSALRVGSQEEPHDQHQIRSPSVGDRAGFSVLAIALALPRAHDDKSDPGERRDAANGPSAVPVCSKAVDPRVGVRRFADERSAWIADDVGMPMTAIAHAIDGGLRHEVNVNGRHTIMTDEPERLGGADLGPAPHELLPAMLASCVSTMIYLYARNRGWELRDVRVEVVYDPEPTPRRAMVRVHLPDELTDAQIKRLQKVAETCPARRALEAGFTFDEQIVVGDYAAPAA